jgi:hypothetical protein
VLRASPVQLILKYFPAAKRIFFGLCLTLAAAVLFYRGMTQPDPTGRKLDTAIGWIAAVIALVFFGRGVWSLLLVWQHDRPARIILTREEERSPTFEDPDEAIRRMSGKR